MSFSSASAEEGDEQHNTDAPRAPRLRKAPERFVPDMTGLVDDFPSEDYDSKEDEDEHVVHERKRFAS